MFVEVDVIKLINKTTVYTSISSNKNTVLVEVDVIKQFLPAVGELNHNSGNSRCNKIDS